jgi:nitronate monooxygenase
VLTGRPARAILNRFIAEQGPISPDAPAFPLATQASCPLRTNAEKQGFGDFPSGQTSRDVDGRVKPGHAVDHATT